MTSHFLAVSFNQTNERDTMKYLATRNDESSTVVISEKEVRHNLLGTEQEKDAQMYLLGKGLPISLHDEFYTAMTDPKRNVPSSYPAFLKQFISYGGKKAWTQEIRNTDSNIDCLIAATGEILIVHVRGDSQWNVYSNDDATIGEILERTRKEL